MCSSDLIWLGVQLQIDHLPHYDGDTAFQGMASAYAVGYVKALLAALEGAPG